MKRNSMLSNELILETELHVTHRYMTIGGTCKKLFLAWMVASLGAGFTYHYYSNARFCPDLWSTLLTTALISSVLATLLVFFTQYKKKAAPVTLFLYAFCKGIGLTAWTIYLEKSYGIPGLAIQTLLATGCVFFAVFFIYMQKWIVVTQDFYRKMYVILMAVVFLSFANCIFALLGIYNPLENLLYGSGIIGIGYSLFLIVLASLFLLADMGFIEQLAQRKQAPKHFEAYCALVMFVTIVWMYMEILRLLARFGNKRR